MADTTIQPPQNPAYRTSMAGGVAGATVTVISAVAEQFHMTVTPELASALIVLVTAGLSFFVHGQVSPGASSPSLSAPAAPAPTP